MERLLKYGPSYSWYTIHKDGGRYVVSQEITRYKPHKVVELDWEKYFEDKDAAFNYLVGYLRLVPNTK